MPTAGRLSRAVLLASLFAASAVLAGCGGGGGGSSDGDDTDDLVVVKFALVDQVGGSTGGRGATNAYRNNRLELIFSTRVDPATVSDRTIQIGVPSGSNLFLTAQGRFTVDGNAVLFDPTITASGAPHPFGFEANSVYSVVVKAWPGTKTVETEKKGKVVLTEFATTFTTTDLYLPDLDQPRIVSVIPTPDTVDVDSAADVIIEFSEAMLPATFDPEVSFRVINTFRGRPVFGTFRFSDDAKTVTFRPTFGYGRGPYEILCILTVDLTDLAGNPIANPQQWTFTTEFDPTAINEGLIEELFDDNLYEDTSFTPLGSAGKAEWNPGTDPGRLVSTFGVTSVTVPWNNGTTGNGWPFSTFTGQQQRVQQYYKASELGKGGTISGLHWFPWAAGYGGTVLGNLIVTLGHTTSTTGLTSLVWNTNLDVPTPVTVLNGVSYTFPSTYTPQQPMALPALQKTFGYNGQNALVLDIGKGTTSTGRWTGWWCRFDSITRRVYHHSSQTASAGVAMDGYGYLLKVDFRTEISMAQSLWYRTESDDPLFLDPIWSPTEQPAGTETLLEWSGAHDDGDGVPDPATFTDWTDDVADLDGHRYLRLRVRFTANLGTGVGPKLDEILVPYLFF